MNVHLYPTPITHESRIERMTCMLAEAKLFKRIVIIGTLTADLPAVQALDAVRTIWRIPRLAETGASFPAKLLKTASWTSRVSRILRGEQITCVTCHSLAVLPLCVRLAQRHRAKLCYEPHELETESVTSRGLRKILMRATEKRLINRIDRIIVVSEEIAQWYRASYGLKNIDVFRNIPALTPQMESMDLRQRFGLSDDDLLFIYSGGLFSGRRVEQFLRIFPQLPLDRHIVFMGFGPLAQIVQEGAKRFSNIHFLPAVPPNQVLAHLRGGDVGLCGVENRCLSYYFSLPNKQFEYLHAGLGSLVPNFPEMSKLITTTQAGWIVPEDTDAAWLESILRLHPRDIATARSMAAQSAPHYTLLKETELLTQTYRSMGFPHGD